MKLPGVHPLHPILVLLVGLLLPTGCYDVNEIIALAASPDGQYLAVATAHEEIGILDLQAEDPMKVYTRYAGRGMAWSPDSRYLAFVEHLPNSEPAIWLIDPKTGRLPEPVVQDIWMKAEPTWLTGGSMAYLSDRGGEDVDLWVAPVSRAAQGEAPVKLIDHDGDISRLWGARDGSSIVFQSLEGGAVNLWRWWPGSPDTIRLTHNEEGLTADEYRVHFAPEGRHLAYIAHNPQSHEIVWYDLEQQTIQARQNLDQPAGDLTVLDNQRIVVSQGSRLVIWRPEAGLFHRSLVESEWGSLPLSVLARRADGSLAVSLNDNVILSVENPEQLAEGRLHVRRLEDLLRLGYELLGNDRADLTEELFADIWSRAEKPRQRFMIAAAHSWFYRRLQRWKEAESWIVQAIEAAPADGEFREVGRLELQALLFFDQRDSERLTEMLERASTPEESLSEWFGALLDSPASEQAAWQSAGHALRMERYPEAADAIRRAIDKDAPTTIGLRGLSLLLSGGFDPLASVARGDREQLEALMNEVNFQEVLLQVSRMPEPPSFLPAGETRSLLLAQWMVHGDLNLARTLVEQDLANPTGASVDYLEMLRQYLVYEETPTWIHHAVNDVLLRETTAEQLFRTMEAPSERLVYFLAQSKSALIEGDWQKGREMLARARATATPVVGPSLFSDSDSGATDYDSGDPSGELQTYRLLIEVYQAKLYERMQQWEEALGAYRSSLDYIEAHPTHWETWPFEIRRAAGLIEDGRHNPELLNSYLRVLRGMGDPLVNPSYNPGSLQAALLNLETLQRFYAQTWLEPHLQFSRAICYSLLERPVPALELLRRAASGAPGPSLMQRILLESAALRASLDQQALAAGQYRTMRELPVGWAIQTASILSQIEAEWACGLVQSPSERLDEILREIEHDGVAIPERWRQWLYLQMGINPEEMIAY